MFFAYKVSATGLNKIPAISIFSTAVSYQGGNLKVSPNGTKLISVNSGSGLFIYGLITLRKDKVRNGIMPPGVDNFLSSA